MDLMTLDKETFRTMMGWNLDNLEFILHAASNNRIKNDPFWYYFLPTPHHYNGFPEALTALVYDHTITNAIDAGLRMVEIDHSENPLLIYDKLIAQARREQAETGKNVLLLRFTRWCLSEQAISRQIYRVRPLAQERDELLSDHITLKSVYGDDWRRYYKPTERRVV